LHALPWSRIWTLTPSTKTSANDPSETSSDNRQQAYKLIAVLGSRYDRNQGVMLKIELDHSPRGQPLTEFDRMDIQVDQHSRPRDDHKACLNFNSSRIAADICSDRLRPFSIDIDT